MNGLLDAVGSWWGGTKERLGLLASDPVGFAKSALLDVVPTDAEASAMKARMTGGRYDPQAVRAYQDKMAQMGGLLGSIKVYHGSPHLFDKASTAHIGTGEGAQAYGHGLYTADANEVGRRYADSLGSLHGKPFAIPGVDEATTQNIPAWVVERFRSKTMSVDDAIAEFSNRIKEARANQSKSLQPWLMDEQVAKLQSTIDSIKKLRGVDVSKAHQGYLYEMNLRWPDAAREAADPLGPQHFLDWDKPLSQQPEAVLKKLGYHNKPRDFARESAAKPGTPEYAELERLMDTRIGSPAVPDVTGAEFYREQGPLGIFQDKGAEQAMTEYLRSLGIPGIRYLDAGSRGAGAGTSNYVVFDDGLIEILTRNGKPVK